VGQEWVALLGWGSAALKCGVRDRWIDWESHPRLLPEMHPWESPHQNAAVCTKLQTRRTEEAPLGWGRPDHGLASDPILCSLESKKAALSPAD
jgi:hypothetical protein